MRLPKHLITVDFVLREPDAPCRVLSKTALVTAGDIPYLHSRFDGDPHWLGRPVVDEPGSWHWSCCDELTMMSWFNFDEQKVYVAGPKVCPRSGRQCCNVDAIFRFMLDRLDDDWLLEDENVSEEDWLPEEEGGAS